MADLPDTFADDDAAVGDRAVLSTKLHLPRPPATFVARTRLAERLDAAAPGSIVLVCAPAGWGKSVLVADWCRRGRAATAWLSLDAADNDPIRFWRHVAAAFDRSQADESSSLRQRVDRVIRRSSDGPFDEVVETIVNTIDDAFDDVVLVLDDYHVIDDARVHETVRLLLERAPERLRIAVLSRADPPLLLARRRARGELAEIRAADLRFSADEAAGLLGATSGRSLPEQAVSALTERTEGWAVGLQLAALSLDGRKDVATFLSTFSGSHRFVLDYLTEEVLDRQPAHVREFLLSTSILHRLSGPSCDALTGGGDGQELLQACERANLFLVALDDDRRWWRYHHLFAELLRLRLEQRDPRRIPELHRRAAAWHERNGFIDQAIGHAVAAHDPDRAVHLIERHADELLFRREGTTLQRHLHALPTGATRRLLVAQARTATYAGRLAEADRLLDAAAVAGAEPDPGFEPSGERTASPLTELDPTTALVRAFIAHLRGQQEAASALARRTLADLDDTASTVGRIAAWYLAVDPWLSGAVTLAEPALAADLDRWQAMGDVGRGALSGHYLGRVQRSRGDLDAATETHRLVLSLADGNRSSEPPTAVAHVGLAEIAYQRGDIDAARRHATHGIALGRQLVYTQALASGLATLAWIRRAEGDLDGAASAMDEAIDVGPDSDVVDLLNPVPVRRAQLLLAAGDDRPAEQWTELRGVAPEDEPYHPAEPTHLLLARLMIHRGQGPLATPLLGRLLDAAATDGRIGSVIEIEVLRALALADTDPADAVTTLGRAVKLAAPQRHLRVFVDEGAPMAALLGDLVASPPPDGEHGGTIEHMALLLRLFDRDVGQAVRGERPRQPLVVPLTDRELDVLDHLATGKSNREIADELYVSLNTVKKHITHILEKLGAANRTAAVDRARTLDLLR